MDKPQMFSQNFILYNFDFKHKYSILKGIAGQTKME